MRETIVSLIPKEEIVYYGKDITFIDFITNNLTKAISERIVQILDTSDDIIIKKPVLRVSEYQPTNSVEYRKTFDWKPLVRCKDCENYQTEWDPSVPGTHYCAVMDGMMKPNDFCSYAERRINE